MRWFYDFKLHIIINDQVELLDFVITQVNVDDKALLKEESFFKRSLGVLYGDKGYLSKELATMLFDEKLHLVGSIRNSMKI